MAKRQRGGARPGQRAPLQRAGHAPAKAGAAPASPVRPQTLGDDELLRAAELEAQIVAEERAATASLSRDRDRRRIAPDAAARPRSRAAGALTTVADQEYGYVVRDVRRIAFVFALIFGLLLASWLAIVVGGIVEI